MINDNETLSSAVFRRHGIMSGARACTRVGLNASACASWLTKKKIKYIYILKTDEKNTKKKKKTPEEEKEKGKEKEEEI